MGNIVRFVLLAPYFLLGASVVTLLAYHLIPLPSTLMDHIKAFSRSDAEVLFIGSSFTGLGIDADVLRENGVRGFVFGVPAMGGEELRYVLRETLERRPDSLESVWVEIKQWEPGAAHGRSRHWRTYSPLGRGLLAFGHGGAGAWVHEPEEGHRTEAGQIFSFQIMDRWIDPNEGDIDWPLQAEIGEFIQSQGLEPVFFLPPTRIEPEPYVFAVEDFNNPARYPELFEYEVRWDSTHLNVKGARRWSEILAERIRSSNESRPQS